MEKQRRMNSNTRATVVVVEELGESGFEHPKSCYCSYRRDSHHSEGLVTGYSFWISQS
jgi:hypothetical protein